MICCLNPDCYQPINSDDREHCEFCNTKLIPFLDQQRYQVIKPLGRGAFGKTYEARVTRIGTSCVVKQLAPRGELNEKLIELFRREAEMLKRLDGHPQIPTLLDFFNDKDYLYLVQQFIPGQTLQQELKAKGRYSETEVQQFLVNLMQVLVFVHGRGVIHRDLKPANIMRHTDGRLFLIDFGVSKDLGWTLETRVGTRAGTDGYMAYEHITERKTTAANDLYAMGAIAFYLLTGTPPDKLSDQHGYSWTDRWRSFLPLGFTVGETLSGVLDKLLKKDYKERYQSAQDVLQDLGISQFPSAFTPQLALNVDPLATTVLRSNFTADLNGASIEMVYIPAGKFKMGSPNGEGDEDEHPDHWVTVPAFYMGKTPITQKQYHLIMGKNPSYFKDDEQLPVEQVSWDDAVEFCQKLSEKSDKTYRLPSEAEWEYACRAGTTTRYYFEDDESQLGDYAWYANNSGDQLIDALQIWESDRDNYYDRIFTQNKCRTHPVAGKKPNEWGLYDMHGNVWEWCQDHWHENYKDAPKDGSAWLNDNDNRSRRLLRGGSWDDISEYCRSANRNRYNADFRHYSIGFRVVFVFP